MFNKSFESFRAKIRTLLPGPFHHLMLKSLKQPNFEENMREGSCKAD